MTGPRLPVVLTRRAERQIERANEWWQVNRPAVPGAIWEALVEALDLISLQPGAGTPARTRSIRGVRRLFLRRIGYFLYYRVARRRQEIQVLSFWHASRGAGPTL